MSHLNFLRIRSWDGSQQAAFEQLACQLFEQDRPEDAAGFTRNGRPDGGVECYWTLTNGDVIALQAKFFPDGMTPGRWADLDASVKTALRSHPRLTRYVIAVPYDLPDDGKPEHLSAMVRWKDRQKRWADGASKREVAFTWWGAHELTGRMDQERNAGRRRFWFDQDAFDAAWFSRMWRRAERHAGDRYQPRLGVEVPIGFHLHSATRTEVFARRFHALTAQVRRDLKDVRTRRVSAIDPAGAARFQALASELQADLRATAPSGLGTLPIDPLNEAIERLRDVADGLLRQLRANPGPSRRVDPSTPSGSERISAELHFIDKAEHSLFELGRFLGSTAGRVAARPALLLSGDAGAGKTHLLADFVRARVEAGGVAVMLFGDDAPQDGAVSQQLLTALDLGNVRLSEFLGALQAAAQARGERALIVLDGINEGSRTAWQRDLAGLLSDMGTYPEIAVVVSVRTTAQRLFLSEEAAALLVEVKHPGFEGVEEQALNKYFRHFGIDEPGAPLLDPEFSNPLFLFLLCREMKAQRLHEIPQGVAGFLQLLAFFIRGVETRLAIRLNYDQADRRAELALFDLARRMVDVGRATLTSREAETICCSRHTPTGPGQELLRALVVEGFLGRVGEEDDRLGAEPGIRFLFERIGDHLRAEIVAGRLSTEAEWRVAVAPGGPLHPVFADARALIQHWGLVEALALRAPEQAGVELLDLVEGDPRVLRSGFLHSLVWRRPAACSQRTAEVFIEVINDDQHADQATTVLLTLAPRPDHPLNGGWLHGRLLPRLLAERDCVWSTRLFLAMEDDEDPVGRTIRRTLDWALNRGRKSGVSDAVVRQCALTIAWWLTTSHRPLRDRATKALVALLTSKPGVLVEVLAAFEGVNDPYVAERLFAVAYGCAMRSSQPADVALIATEVHRQVFGATAPADHLLLRDYARGVLERCAAVGALPAGIDLAYARPPYRSGWQTELPSLADLRGRFRSGEEERSGADTLSRSVSAGGDFDRYVMGTDSSGLPWTYVRSGTPVLTAFQTLRAFDRTLEPAQRRTFYEWLALVRGGPRVAAEKISPELHADLTLLHDDRLAFDPARRAECHAASARVEAARDLAQTALLASLSGSQLEAFHERIRFAANPHERQPGRFPASRMYRWVLNRILELGYDASLLGDFDRHHGRDIARSAHKPERIGKKYQWIAWHQFLAHVADNFRFSAGFEGKPSTYRGPWQLPHGRDIDPSSLLTRTLADAEQDAWWARTEYEFGRGRLSDRQWLSGRGLPEIGGLFEATDAAGQRWIALDVLRDWCEGVPEGDEHEGLPQRDVRLRARSYIVRARGSKKLWRWLNEEPTAAAAFPARVERRDTLFLRERGWSAAWRDSIADDGADDWTRGSSFDGPELPVPVRHTSEAYTSEGSSGYDCSVEDYVRLHVPAPWLASTLGLHHSEEDGVWADEVGVAAFDPTTREPGPGTMLLRADLLAKLRGEGLEVVWVITGTMRAGCWTGVGSYDCVGESSVVGGYRLGVNGPESFMRTRLAGWPDRARRRATSEAPDAAAPDDES